MRSSSAKGSQRVTASLLRRTGSAMAFTSLSDGPRGPERSAVGVAGRDVIGVEALPEEQLAAEAALGPLARHHLIALLGLPAPLGAHREDVLLDREIDGVGVDPGEVELHHELLPVAVGVHGHDRPAKSPPPVLGDTVEPTE